MGFNAIQMIIQGIQTSVYYGRPALARRDSHDIESGPESGRKFLESTCHHIYAGQQ